MYRTFSSQGRRMGQRLYLCTPIGGFAPDTHKSQGRGLYTSMGVIPSWRSTGKPLTFVAPLRRAHRHGGRRVSRRCVDRGRAHRACLIPPARSRRHQAATWCDGDHDNAWEVLAASG